MHAIHQSILVGLLGFSLLTPALAAPTPVADEFNPVSANQVLTHPVISDDGRYVVYFRNASSNNTPIEVFDRVTRTTEIVSLKPDGQPMTGQVGTPAISADGRYVLFSAHPNNMGLAAGISGYFVYDRVTRTLETVVTAPNVITSMRAGISPNGRYVAYRLRDPAITPASRLYVRDMLTKVTTELTGAANLYLLGNDGPAISNDGRYITYLGRATANSNNDLTTYDVVTGTSTLTNVNSAGERENRATGLSHFGMSADGNKVVFASSSTNLDGTDTNTGVDVFVRDRVAGTTRKISFGQNGASSGEYNVGISADGRYVVYTGIGVAGPGQTGAAMGVYRYDLLTNIARAAPLTGYKPTLTAISANGRYVAYDFYYTGNKNAGRIGVTDYGPPAELVLSESALELTEGGIAGTYTAVLNQAPTANVVLNINPGPQLQLARSQLTFTTANWNTPQVISVQAINDGVAEGVHDSSVSQKTASADADFNVVAAATVAVAISDPVVPTIAAPSGGDAPDIALSGKAAPGVTVLITAVNNTSGALVSVSALADGEGNWNVTLTDIGYGSIELQADANGIKSAVYPYQSVQPTPPQ